MTFDEFRNALIGDNPVWVVGPVSPANPDTDEITDLNYYPEAGCKVCFRSTDRSTYEHIVLDSPELPRWPQGWDLVKFTAYEAGTGTAPDSGLTTDFDHQNRHRLYQKIIINNEIEYHCWFLVEEVDNGVQGIACKTQGVLNRNYVGRYTGRP